MAQGATGAWSQTRNSARAICCALAFAALALLVMQPAYAQAQPVRGEASFSANNGYARLVLTLQEDVESEVAVAGSVLIIRFKRPVMIPIEKLSGAVPGYVGSARRDPDGLAIRLALSRKVTVNLMEAGERVFVDLLPDPWTGPPPSLPQEVLRELTERARAAERELRAQRAATEAKKRPPVRVRTSLMPTFARFVFELPDGVGVSSALGDQTLSLKFNAVLTFDLADAKVAAPPNISAIAQRSEGAGTAVDLALIGDVDVKSFREDKTYVVDVGFQQPEKAAAVLPVVPPAQAAAAPQAAPVTPPEGEKVAAPSTDMPSPAPPKQAAAPVREVLAPPVKIAAGPTKDAAPVPSTPERKATAAGAASEARPAGEGARIGFSFASPVAAALFRRADMVWLVLDSAKPVDLDRVRREGGSIVGDVASMALGKAQAVRIKLNRPQLASLIPEPQGWSLAFDDAPRDTQPLVATRVADDPARAHVVIPLPGAGQLHRVVDPEAGDTLFVVTALAPARGFRRNQQFVDFALLESMHGLVVQPNSDQVTATVGSDRVTLTRPGGLMLSPASPAPSRTPSPGHSSFDRDKWEKAKEGDFPARLHALVDAAATATGDRRAAARVDLATFYLARGMYPEGKAVLDLVVADSKPGQECPAVLTMRAAAAALMPRPDLALKDLAQGTMSASPDAQVWRGVALAGQQKWAEAREQFRSADIAVAALPLDLQRLVIAAAMRASLEAKDFAGAASRSANLDQIGAADEQKPIVAAMRGRLAEAMGREAEALVNYREAIASKDRGAAAEAKLHEVALRLKREEIDSAAALPELETLAMTWRGDGTEVRTQHMMQEIYAKVGRYGDALQAARSATQLQPNSDIARRAQDEASELFGQLFLTAKGDRLPPIEALGLFYEYRELTPIGRRGDEMIRRLADRLASVDLLDQASELLQYQVDRRLEGAARAQVASRLAMVYLMNRKPDRAIAALRATRIGDLAGELRQQRLLLEARAQSDIGRHDLALDIITNISGREAVRLRSDVYWAQRRWRESSEQIELYLGDRWRDFTPLAADEKGDVIRAAVGYALADDALGLERFREKYAPLMSGADRIALDGASMPGGASTAEFSAIAKMAASVDTLEGFLRDMRARFPDATARAPMVAADPVSTGAVPAAIATLPAIVGTKRAEAKR